MRGIEMLEIDEVPIFNNNKTTLKETSKDNHDGVDVFMTESTLSVVNFDSVKNEYIREMKLSEAPSSNDTLLCDNHGNWYFIEFKNGYISKEETFEIRRKIFDSLLIFTDIISKGVSYTR